MTRLALGVVIGLGLGIVVAAAAGFFWDVWGNESANTAQLEVTA